jgi:2-deoxy-D-gluconate 3-dehydrogenase
MSLHVGELENPFSLAGRRAVVTGGSRGIGAAIVYALARAGADIVSVHRMAEEPPVAAQVRALGRSYAAVQADVGQVDELSALAGRIIADHSPIDILINNAGHQLRIPAEQFPLDEWRRMLDTHLTAAFVLCQEFGRPMLEHGRGAIVNTASLLSFQGGITVPAYAAAKSGLAGLTRALANEWAGRGVNVNAVAPGYVVTEMGTGLRSDETRNRQIVERIPAGRWGEPEEIAWPVVFLCSPAAGWIHGEVLIVDGGWMSR